MTGENEVICVTTDTVPGRSIRQVLGLIWGIGVTEELVTSRNLEPAEKARLEAYDDLLNRARSMNTDTVVGIASDSFVHGRYDPVREYTIYGTAVTLD